jgi:hypothetical protein
MKTILFRLSAVAIFSLLGCTAALACDCIHRSESTTDALKNYDAVFSGKVVSIKAPKTKRRGKRVVFLGQFVEVKLRVADSWKLVDAEEVTILTPFSDCSYPFKVGEEYLVWAILNEKDPTKLVSGLCARTDKLVNAVKDLNELGEGRKPSVLKSAAKHNKALQLTAR